MVRGYGKGQILPKISWKKHKMAPVGKFWNPSGKALNQFDTTAHRSSQVRVKVYLMVELLRKEIMWLHAKARKVQKRFGGKWQTGAEHRGHDRWQSNGWWQASARQQDGDGRQPGKQRAVYLYDERKGHKSRSKSLS